MSLLSDQEVSLVSQSDPPLTHYVRFKNSNQFILTFLLVHWSLLMKRSMCAFHRCFSRQSCLTRFTCSPAEAWWWVCRARESSSPASASGSLSGGCSPSSAAAGTPSDLMRSSAYSSQLLHRTCRTESGIFIQDPQSSVQLQKWFWSHSSGLC